MVTLQMVWNHQDFDGQLRAQLFKRKGGFFVGSSPEAEIAMGTVAFFESAAGLVNDDEITIDLGDDGRLFRLVIYRNILQDGSRGRYIRSFFPKYVGDGRTRPLGTTTVIRPVRPELSNSGPVIIDAAMPNPSSQGDETGEWIRVKNVGSVEVDLAGWELRDQAQRPLALHGVLGAGATAQFDIVRTLGGIALRNRGGLITLHEPSGALRAAVAYPKAAEGVEVTFRQTGQEPA